MLPSAGEGLYHGDHGGDLSPSHLPALSFPPFAPCLMRAHLLQWIESHSQATARAHSLVNRGCTWRVYCLCEEHLCSWSSPRSPMELVLNWWNWSFTSLMFWSGSNHVPAGIPAVPTDFKQEEHEGSCWVGPLGNSASLCPRKHAQWGNCLPFLLCLRKYRVLVTCLLCRSSSAGRKKQFRK